jgi:ATP-dependent protease ClpP protease subunit
MQPKNFYLNFSSEIHEKSTNLLMAACAEIVDKKRANNIYLMFSSSGGSVEHGITLYNYLKALPCGLVIHNMGSVQSVATVVFHAAEPKFRYAVPHATFMFHGINWSIPSPTALSHTRVDEIKSALVHSENRFASIICGRCTLTEAEVRALFVMGKTEDTAFAVEKGIIKEVREIKIPANAPFASIG